MDSSIGALIRTAETGDDDAAGELFATLYRELHELAERQVRRSGPGLTLGATTLLHEAYVHIASREGVHFASRSHFLAYASRAMRGVTIDYVRRRRAKKRGGEFHITASGLESASDEAGPDADRLEQLSAALDTLAKVDPWLAQLVDLHFFCGFTFVDLAEVRGVSERTIQRQWREARLMLHRVLQDL